MDPVAIKALTGLFLFSALLTTGASLECETCPIIGNSCINGQKLNCTNSDDICMKIVFEGTIGQYTGVKSCFAKVLCDKLQTGQAFDYYGGSTKIKEITCKAPSPSASLLLALAGFLLLKVIF